MTKSPLKTDIFNYHTPEFFINMKNIPDKKSSERASFVLEEKRKCREGINVNGVFIPSSLYFHLNYYHLEGDDPITGKKKIMLPRLRDNEWIFFNDYEKCSTEKIIYLLFGARQIAKSETEVSLCLRELSLFKQTEAMALFSGQPDKDTFVKKMSTAITHGEKFIIVPNIDKDWSKDEIRFGFTKQDNTTELRGRLYIYNTQDGKKIQVGSGKSVSFLLMDEIAKALRHGSKLYYEDKEGFIEDAKVGDKIYDEKGNLTSITGVYPQGVKDIYRIYLKDGRFVDCTSEHLWTVYDNALKKNVTLTTEHLIKTNSNKQIDKRYNKIVKKQRYFLKTNDCINYPEKDLLINPYYLGLWLGDGDSSGQGAITNIDEDVINYLKDFSKTENLLYTKVDSKHHTVSTGIKGKKSKLRDKFNNYNLINNKHIPSDYLHSSFEQRLELLKGLMDTDGSCSKTGSVEITSSYPKLAKDIETLIRSLGIKCVIKTEKSSYKDKEGNKIYCRDSIRFRLFTDLIIFKIKRKIESQLKNIEKCKKSKKAISYINYTAIEKIEFLCKDFATCIRVDNDSHLFLTDNFIPTHNSSYRAVYDTIEPALLSDFGGLRCAPILAFTGGETEKARDAKNMVENPNKETQFTTIIENDKEIGGRFISGLYRKDCKEETKFSDFIGKKTDTWLDNYTIFVSNFEKAQEKIKKEKEDALKSPDKSTYTLKRIFFPLNLDDVFLTESNNNFPVEDIKPYIEKLEKEFEPEEVELYRSTEGIKLRHSNKHVIKKFPVNSSDYKDAPTVLIERPIAELPFGAYVGGLDPYNENESSDKVNSLGCLYIFKRMHNPLGENQYAIVAYYTARPDTLKEFKENCLLLMEYYNAYTLIERSNSALIDWFIEKGKGHLLADGLEIAKEINPKSSTRAIKGLQPTTPNQRYGMDALVEYTKESFEYETDSGEIKNILGFMRIKDPMLLTEMVNYRAKSSATNSIHDGNYDRIISAYHALILAKHLDKYSPVITPFTDNEYKGRNIILSSALPIHKSSSPNRSKNTLLNSPFNLRR